MKKRKIRKQILLKNKDIKKSGIKIPLFFTVILKKRVCMKLLLLPHQLYDVSYFPEGITEVILYEHPHYFKKYNYNKKKLILHRASLQAYYEILEKKKYKTTYIPFNKKLPPENFFYFDPIDSIKIKGKMLESPNFLISQELQDLYRKKTKNFLFNNFYMWSKKELNLYPVLKSQDKKNRQTYDKNIKVPPHPSNKADAKYIKEAIEYIEKHFKKNYGTKEDFIFPVTHATAKKWLKDFIEKRFNHFGPYQDFVQEDKPYMFHSLLSSSINIGLLQPSDVIAAIKKVKSKIPLNSFEGFLRQLFWREYQRYCTRFIDFKKYNYFKHSKPLTKKWYEGSLGIKPIDDLIHKAFDTAYLHHIERLMFVGNFMNLSEINPQQGFKWFMEFSIDSYEWVMYQNVYDMVFFATEGMTMRKPYISSSNYVLKMSSYKKGEWSDIWNDLYKNFLKKHQKKLWKYRYHFPSLKNL